MEWFCGRAEEGTAGLPQRWPLSAVPDPWEEWSVPELCAVLLFLFSPQEIKGSRLPSEGLLTMVPSKWEEAVLM